MATGTYLPNANIQYFDNDGLPLAGGKLRFYAAGTTTPLDTYSDVALLTPNPVPITLDASGKSPTPIFISNASYKQSVKNSVGVEMDGWPKDNIASVALTTTPSGVTIFVFGGNPSSPIPAAQVAYPSGTGYDKTHAGSTGWAIDSGDIVGLYDLQAQLQVVGVGTVTLGLFNLTDGSPDTPLTEISSASTVGARVVNGPIAFASAGATKTYAIKVKTTGGVIGFAWMAQIIRQP